VQAGVAIGLASLMGGIVPLAPYIFISNLQAAIPLSIAISFGSLFLVGAIKGRITKRNFLVSGGEMLLVGIVAALIVFEIGKVLAFA
jgi:predicted membrane protein (TIGR00267 family)